jgi:tetratricopeptide (TPR) repeat protein
MDYSIESAGGRVRAVGRMQHADAALVLDGEFAKSHFRRGLALQGLTRYADACGAFARAVELDPKNAQAKSAIQMCQMQLQRQARR